MSNFNIRFKGNFENSRKTEIIDSSHLYVLITLIKIKKWLGGFSPIFSFELTSYYIKKIAEADVGPLLTCTSAHVMLFLALKIEVS